MSSRTPSGWVKGIFSSDFCFRIFQMRKKRWPKKKRTTKVTRIDCHVVCFCWEPCDCHEQIYDLPFGTLVVSHDPLANASRKSWNEYVPRKRETPQNSNRNTWFQRETPAFFSMVLHVETNKIIPQSSPSFLRCGTLVDHSWVVWEGPHSHTAGEYYILQTSQI